MTPEEAWAAFEGLMPAKLVPARRCECGQRVPEEYAIWHAEELHQMRSVFLDLYRRCSAASHGLTNGSEDEDEGGH